MTLPSAAGETIVRQRATLVDDDYGGGELDWTNPDELTIAGCALAPITVEELLTAGRNAATDAWTLYAPWADITHADRIRRGSGEVFEVDGHPNRWRSPHTGRQPGMTVRLRRITGTAS